MKKLGVAALAVSLALTAACSKDEETTAGGKGSKPTEESSTDTGKQETKTESQNEQETEESTQEEYNIIEPFDVSKRDEVLYKSDKGSLILLGETINSEGQLVAAVKSTGELKNSKLDDLYLKFITDQGGDYTFDSEKIESYRAKDDSLITVYQSTSEVPGSKMMRVDYSLNGEITSENTEVKSIKLDETSDTEKVPGLKDISSTSPDLNVVKENDDYKITFDAMDLDPEDLNKIILRGTIEAKKDMEYKEDIKITRPALKEQINTTLDFPSSDSQISNYQGVQLYKDVPVDFALEIKSEYPIGKDKGAIFNIGSKGFGFSLDAATGKEYKSDNPVSLIDLPEMYGTNGMGEIPIEGYTDIGGNSFYNVIESSDPNWDWGIGDTSERETIQYALGSNYKKLKVKIGAGSALKDSNGDYDFFIYGDDYNVEQDQEPTGTPLIHEKLKSNSPMKEFDIDVSGVNQLTIYYRTNKAPGSGMGDEDETQKYVQVLVADSELSK